MEQLPQELIEKALALTGKTIDLFYEDTAFNNYESFFSIEKFCFYLLSSEFIENVSHRILPLDCVCFFAKAIHEYQKGNSEQLIYLLSKI